MLISTEGIVLKQRKISNNRRIIVIFTKKYGKISAGTGINERSKGKAALALRPFSYANFDLYKNKGYYNINGAEVVNSFYSLGEDIDRFLIASKLLEYLDLILQEEQAKPKLFDLAVEFLEEMSVAKRSFDTMLTAFIVKTFGMLGIMPELRHCVNCGRREDDENELNRFSINDGGMLCEDCFNKAKRDDSALIFKPKFDIVKLLKFFSDNPFSVYQKVELKTEYTSEIREIISEYVKHYLNIDILDKNLIL